jgi:NADH-quinone oxidoreductase subunit J
MMEVLFYTASVVTLVSTAAALTQTNATHALIYLILSLLAVAVVFFVLGAPFAAALQILIYAGAIMVLFVFVVMILNLGDIGEERERQWLGPRAWILPALLAALLLAEVLIALGVSGEYTSGESVAPKAVGLSLYGPYVLAVEIASMLLLSALVGSYHVARTYLAHDKGGDS